MCQIIHQTAPRPRTGPSSTQPRRCNEILMVKDRRRIGCSFFFFYDFGKEKERRGEEWREKELFSWFKWSIISLSPPLFFWNFFVRYVARTFGGCDNYFDKRTSSSSWEMGIRADASPLQPKYCIKGAILIRMYVCMYVCMRVCVCASLHLYTRNDVKYIHASGCTHLASYCHRGPAEVAVNRHALHRSGQAWIRNSEKFERCISLKNAWGWCEWERCWDGSE